MLGNIEFSDKVFELAIKNAISCQNEKITYKDIEKIKGIMISEEEVRGIQIPWIGDSSAFSMVLPNVFFNIKNSKNGKWMEDLQHFNHIQALYIFTPTETVSFLKEFTELSDLYIEECKESNWTFLAKLIKLKDLYLNSCPFVDLQPLEELYLKQKELSELKRKKNEMSLFWELSKLSNVALINCNLKDVTALGKVKTISDLNLSHNQIEDIRPLLNISHLYYLTARHNAIIDISCIKELKGIYYLNLRHNFISDISVLKYHRRSNLSRLLLEHNPIKDYDPLKKLYLVYCDCEEYQKRRNSN